MNEGFLYDALMKGNWDPDCGILIDILLCVRDGVFDLEDGFLVGERILD